MTKLSVSLSPIQKNQKNNAAAGSPIPVRKFMIFLKPVSTGVLCTLVELKELVQDIARVLKTRSTGLLREKDTNFLLNPKDGTPLKYM